MDLGIAAGRPSVLRGHAAPGALCRSVRCSRGPARRLHREVERCAAAGCRGVGELYPDGQAFTVDDLADVGPLLEVCRALQLPILIHASEPVGHSYRGKGGTTPERLYGLLRLAADVPLILAHCGGGFAFYELMPEVAALTEQVYYDTAAAAYLYRPAAVARLHDLAPGRVLFGSDYRLLSQRRMLRYVREAGLPPEAAAAVLGGNAARLLGLPCGLTFLRLAALAALTGQQVYYHTWPYPAYGSTGPSAGCSLCTTWCARPESALWPATIPGS